MTEYGLWDEVRINQGKEWVLSLYVQEWLLQCNRPPVCLKAVTASSGVGTNDGMTLDILQLI